MSHSNPKETKLPHERSKKGFLLPFAINFLHNMASSQFSCIDNEIKRYGIYYLNNHQFQPYITSVKINSILNQNIRNYNFYFYLLSNWKKICFKCQNCLNIYKYSKILHTICDKHLLVSIAKVMDVYLDLSRYMTDEK